MESPLQRKRIKKFLLVTCFLLVPFFVSAQIDSACSCVEYARTLVDFLPHGDAEQFQYLPASFPTIKGIVLFRYDDVWHIGVLSQWGESGAAEGFWVDERLTVKDKPGCITRRRFVSWNDSHLVRFLRFQRVSLPSP